MHFLKRFLASLIANGLGLYIAALTVTGVSIPLAVGQFTLAVLALTFINLFIKPFVKFILTPIIILTLGLASLVVNALILYLLDFLLTTVTIDGLVALVLATLVVTAANLTVKFSLKKL